MAVALIRHVVRGWMICIAISCTTLVGCKQSVKPTAQDIEAGLGEYATIFEAGVRLRLPIGFEQEWFSGFGNPQSRSMIIAKSLPTGFNSGFDKHAASLKEKKVLSRETVTVHGRPGVLLHTRQRVDNEVGHAERFGWDLVFGDETESKLISAIYYNDAPPLTSETLRAAVLSAEFDGSPIPKPGERQSFTLAAPQLLKPVAVSWKYLAFTEDGEVPTKSAIAPIFSAGNFPKQFEPNEDLRAFAETMLRAERGVGQIEMQSSAEITLDGLSGYELLANAIYTKSEKPVVLYYLVLFEDKEYIMLSGYCGAENSDVYLPEFKAMAHSFEAKTEV